MKIIIETIETFSVEDIMTYLDALIDIGMDFITSIKFEKDEEE